MPTKSPLVSLIIVSYATRDLLEDCLRSLPRGTEGIEVEVIVVDNASADGSAEMVAESFPEVQLIRSPQNVGFAAANNLAIQQAKGEYLFFLNPDTLLPPASLSKLVRFLEDHPKAAVAGAGLTYPQGLYQPFGFRFPSLFREFWNFLPELKWLLKVRSVGRLVVSILHLRSSNWSQTTDLREVDCINGAAFLARSEAIRKIGGFDGTFFLYHEEMDLCTRLRKASWEVWSLPKAQVIHFDAQASGYSSRRFAQAPVLEWRVKGMDYLWSQHKSALQHRLWRKQARALLCLRIGLLSVKKVVADTSSQAILHERIRSLKELREALTK